jgi:diacylglycerol kinase (ATP)
MKALFVVNMRSGVRPRVDINQFIRDRAAACGMEYELFTCDRKEDLDEVVPRAEREGFEVVYAVGGDGTVREVARHLIGRRLALGILPTGSGNGFARHIGVRSLDLCQDGSVVEIDTAEVNGIPYVGVMGVGLDAVIADRFARAGTRGFRTYARVGLQTLGAFQAEEYEVETAGRSIKRRAYIVAVANSSQYGNDARIAPLASLRDGLLDVVVIENVSLVAVPMMMLRLFRGTLHRSGGVSVIQAPEVTIRRSKAGPAHLDGEPEFLGAELHVRVRPRSLRVLVPRGVERL